MAIERWVRVTGFGLAAAGAYVAFVWGFIGLDSSRSLPLTSDQPVAADLQAAAPPRAGGGDGLTAWASSGNQAVTVAADSARVESFPTIRSGLGWIEPLAAVKVRARTEGQIVERLVDEGAIVREGDLLFRIDGSELEAQVAREQAMLTRDRASLARIEADLARARELLARNVGLQAKIDQLVSDVAVSSAAVAASEATLRMTRIKLERMFIRAPIGGRVGTVRSVRGDIVGPSDETNGALLTITQPKPLQVAFSLPEREVHIVRRALAGGSQPQVRIFAGGLAGPPASAKLTFVDSSVDTKSGTILVKALIPNEDETLWPGLYVRVEARLGDGPSLVTVPLTAIQPGQRHSSVFVINSDGTVSRRIVEVIARADSRAGVRGDVRPGERVVVEGQFKLRHGMQVRTAPSRDAPVQTATSSNLITR
jgi:multidrug efflux system membrane fusion protein